MPKIRHRDRLRTLHLQTSENLTDVSVGPDGENRMMDYSQLLPYEHM